MRYYRDLCYPIRKKTTQKVAAEVQAEEKVDAGNKRSGSLSLGSNSSNTVAVSNYYDDEENENTRTNEQN